jgi:ketol-acid reductoisomerase
LDLFSEQALWPALFECLLTAYDVLVEKGYPREAVALEMYASGEAADIFRAMAQKGMFEQMRYHSPTSQYGVLSRRENATGAHQLLYDRMAATLENIRNGRFADEWAEEQKSGYTRFEKLKTEARAQPINEADRVIRQLLEPGRAQWVPTSS